MKINAINYNYICANNFAPKNKSYNSNYTCIKSNTFNAANSSNVSFTGIKPFYFYRKTLETILKHKAYKNSIKGSKRPYLEIRDDLKYAVKPVQIKVSLCEKINAFDINPKNSDKYVIFLHGFSHNITSNQNLYKALIDTDFGILAIDYRGYGKNLKSHNISEYDMKSDVLAAKRYLNKKDVYNIGLIGHSFGGYLAAKTSKNTHFDFQIFVSPMLSLQFWYENVIRHPRKHRKEHMLIKHVPYLKTIYPKIFQIKKHMAGNSTPTYIVHSRYDRYINPNSVGEFINETASVKDYIFLKTGGHKMDDPKINAIKEILQNLN